MVLLPVKKRGKRFEVFRCKKIDFISGAHQVIRKISNNIPLFLVESVTLGFYAKSVEALYIFFKTASNIWCSCGDFSLFSWLVTFCCKCAQRVCLSSIVIWQYFGWQLCKTVLKQYFNNALCSWKFSFSLLQIPHSGCDFYSLHSTRRFFWI